MHMRSIRRGKRACLKSAASIGPAPTRIRFASAQTNETVMASDRSLTISPCEAPNEIPPSTPIAPKMSVRRHAHGRLKTAYF
jgi:hypothetical protein